MTSRKKRSRKTRSPNATADRTVIVYEAANV